MVSATPFGACAVVALGLGVGLALGLATPAAADWKPERPVHFIAMFSPGGGHDIMMRTSSQMMLDLGITDASIQVRNLPGGSGARAMEYLYQQAGDGHYLSAATSTLITVPLRGGTEISHRDFTPIALLAFDPAVIAVRADSPYQTMEEFLEAAADQTMNMGATSVGGQGHLVTLALSQESGVPLNFIPFDGDGDLSAALLGGQIDIMSANYNTAYDFIQAGEFRPLAISASERIEDLPDVPTLIDLGYDVNVILPRGIIGPPDMPEEAQEYWINVFKELSDSERWTEEYIERFNLVKGDLYGEDYAAYLEQEEEFFRTMLEEGGLID